ncbi:MAG: GAF domain-containing protein, partial [Bacteroidota bacterium]
MPVKYHLILILFIFCFPRLVYSQSPALYEELESAPPDNNAVHEYGDSWNQIISSGKGRVTILYTHNIPFIYNTPAGDLAGIEYEVMHGFLDFVRDEYNVELEVNWLEEPSFKDFYNKVKHEKNGILGVSSVSITKARMNEVQFSPPYIPDIEIIISSGNLPMANNMAEFSELVRNNKAITLRQSTFEENFKYIKKNYFPHLDYAYSPNLGSILDTITHTDGLYAYVQITNYGKALDKGEYVKRQRFFIVENPGLAMVMPFESDWIHPVNTYFQTKGFQPLIDSLTVKYLGKTTTTLMNEVTKDTSKVDYKVHLGNEIQLLTAESEIQKLRLQQKELEINNQKETTKFLTIGIIAVVILIAILFFFYKRQRFHNKELALKNIEIARTAKSLKKSYRDLELLSEAGKDITSNLTFSRIIKNVWRNIDALIGVDKYGIGIYDQSKKTLVFKGAREGKKVLGTFEIRIDPRGYIAAYCFDRQQEIFINDYNLQYSKYTTKKESSPFMVHAKAVIAFPLIVNGITNGVVIVQRKENNSFTDYHFRLLKNLSVYANIALQNAGVFEELAVKSRRLKIANDNITEQNLKIEKQNEDLIQLDHEKN